VASERTRFERFISALDPDRRAALVRAQAERAKAAAEAKAGAAAAAPIHASGGAATPGAHAAATAPGANAGAARSPAATTANDSAASTASEAAPAPATFTLRLGGAAHTVPYAPGLTLLAAAQRAGVGAPSSCEDGYCGTCAARLVHGKVTMRSTQALTPAELAAGAILLCQSLPAAAEPLEVTCAAPSAAAQPALPERPPQPLLPRVLASLFVLFVFALFFLFRSRP
jgi:ferredoxin